MSAFETISFVAIVVMQTAISIWHSHQIRKLTEETCQLYARIGLLELEVSDNDQR